MFFAVEDHAGAQGADFALALRQGVPDGRGEIACGARNGVGREGQVIRERDDSRAQGAVEVRELAVERYTAGCGRMMLLRLGRRGCGRRCSGIGGGVGVEVLALAR